MKLPIANELNEFNRLLMAISYFTHNHRSCSISSIISFCSSIALGGKSFNHKRTIDLCSITGLITVSRRMVRLTELGQRFLDLNPESLYEITNKQKQFIADEVVLKEAWKSHVRDFVLCLTPNYSEITYELSLVDNPIPERFNHIVYLLKVLYVLEENNRILSVKPDYVKTIRQLRAEKQGLSQEEIEEALRLEQKLSIQAEEAVVIYERKRLESLGTSTESHLVRRVSQLDVGAGYDVESFDRKNPLMEHDRFIEVKSSEKPEIFFFLTANELRVAKEKGNRYWIYFLKEFKGGTPHEIEPIMIQNPAKRLCEIDGLNVRVSKYLITQDGNPMLTEFKHKNTKGYIL